MCEAFMGVAVTLKYITGSVCTPSRLVRCLCNALPSLRDKDVEVEELSTLYHWKNCGTTLLFALQPEPWWRLGTFLEGSKVHLTY